MFSNEYSYSYSADVNTEIFIYLPHNYLIMNYNQENEDFITINETVYNEFKVLIIKTDKGIFTLDEKRHLISYIKNNSDNIYMMKFI